MEKLIIIGTGMNARHAWDFIKFYDLFEVVGFAVDEEYRIESTYLGLPVFSINELPNVVDENTKLFVAVFWNKLNADRRFLYERLKKMGYRFANLISPSAIVHGSLDGDNCWLHDYVIVNTDAHIGNDVMIMARAFVGQDSIVEDHCFVGAGSLIATCHIGEQSFVGVSATLFDGVKIGKNVWLEQHVP